MRFLILILLAAKPATTVLPCSMLTAGDVRPIFGELKGDPRPDTGLRGESDCRYYNLDGQWLKTSVYGADRWSLEKGITSEQQQTDLPNLGDEAFSAKPGHDSVVYMRKGQTVVEVSCSCGMDKTRQLAAKAAARLVKGGAQ